MALRALTLAGLLAASSGQSFGAGTAGAVVHSVSPRNGSLAGGTQVTITGSGFQRGGIVGGTNVFIGHLPCHTVDYWTTDERIVCETDELHNFSVGSSYYPVRIAMHSQSAASFARGQFSFRYWDAATPFVRRSSSGVAAGGALKFGGLLRAPTTDSISVTINELNCPMVHEYVATDEDGVDITQQLLDDESLGRRRRQSANLELGFVETLAAPSIDRFAAATGSVDVDARVVAERVSDDVNEACTLPTELEAGRYNYTVNVAPAAGFGFGNAKFFERSQDAYGSRDLVSVTETGAHAVTVFPVISSLSTQQSGDLGGHNVTISGRGFATSCTANQVTLAGAPCRPVSCSVSQIVCVAGNGSAALTAAPFPNTAGLVERWWSIRASSMNFESSLSTYATPTRMAVALDGAVTTTLANTTRDWSSEQTGVFVAPRTGQYRFWVIGDDFAQVELNPAGVDVSGLQVVASLSGASSTSGRFFTDDYTTRPSQKSTPIALAAGERYAFRTRHVAYRAPDYFQAAVEILGAPASSVNPQYHRVNERQRAVFSSVLERQVQRIDLNRTTGGVLDLIGGDAGTYNFTISPTGAVSGLTSALREVVSGCRSFGITTDASLLTVNGFMSIAIEFRCSPRFVSGSTTVSPWPPLRISTQRLGRFSPSRSVVGRVTNVRNPSDPITGSFSLSLAGITHATATVAYTYDGRALASRIRSSLRGFATVQDVDVTVSGDMRYNPRVQVDFLVPQAFNYAPIEFDLGGLRGTNVTVLVSTQQHGAPGSILYDPIPARFFEVGAQVPMATIISNGINGVCEAADGALCSFDYNSVITPTVTSVVADTVGDLTFSNTLTITGTGLRVGFGGVHVMFGGSECLVTAHSTTSIECTVGHCTRGSYVPEVIVEAAGRARTTGLSPLAYGFSVASVSPRATGYRGGTRVTLTGTGFSRNGAANAMTIGGSPCEVVTDPAPRPDQVVCIAPAASGMNLSATTFASLPAVTAASLSIGFFDDHAEAMRYVASMTPSITAITPSELSAAITTAVNISGDFLASGFVQEGGGCQARMDFVSPSGAVRYCSQLEITAEGASCLLVRGEVFAVSEQRATFPRLNLCTLLPDGSFAAVIAQPEPPFGTIDLALRIDSMSPQSGSLAGGTLVTIRGSGFADDSERIVRSALTFNFLTPMVVVNLTLPDRNVPCLLTNSNFTTIECTTVFPSTASVTMTSSPPNVYRGGGFNTEVAVSVNDIVAPGCVSNSNGDSSPPQSVTTAAPLVFVPGSGSFCAGGLGSFCMSWQPAVDQGHIQFSMNGSTTGYLALGVTDQAGVMGPADVMMCMSSGGNVTVSDRFNPARGVNQVDATQDLTFISGGIVGGLTHCTFTRPLVAAQTDDRPISAGPVNLIWAMGALASGEPTPVWHGLTNRGSMTESLLVVEAPDSGSGSGSGEEPAPLGTNSSSGGPSPGYAATVVTFVDVLATSCSFNYADARTPTLAAATPPSGAAQTAVTLTGTGFSSQPVVFVGDSPAQVLSFTSTTISIIVPAMTAGAYFVRVEIPGAGFAAHPTGSPVTFRSLLQLTSVQPSQSSTAGGLIITYTGAGFAPEEKLNVLTINGIRAHVINTDFDQLVAVTPELPGSQVTVASVDLTVPTEQIGEYFFGQTEQSPIRYTANTTLPSTGVSRVGGDYTLPETYSVTDSNAITYTPSVTPVVTSVTPSFGQAGTSITITGQGLLGPNVTEVLIGAEACVVNTSSATQIICTVGQTPAGEHRVFVTVAERGTARGDLRFNASMQITGISSSFGSFGGGTVVTISGTGFGGGEAAARRSRRQTGPTLDGAWQGWLIFDLPETVASAPDLGTVVTLCGLNCTVNSSSYTSVVCDTPKLTSPESIAAFQAEEPEQLTSDTFVAEIAPQSVAAQAFDNDFATHFTSGSWVGLDFGADVRVVVTKMRYFPAHQQASRFIGSTFETSVDGVTWSQLPGSLGSTTDYVPHQGWNWANFNIAGQVPARFVRMVSQDAQMFLAMLEVFGHSVSPVSDCPVTVQTTAPLSHPSLGQIGSNGTVMSTAVGPQFTYSVNNTPIVTAVNPRYGSSLGGDRITISGENLPTSVQDTEVTFSGVACNVVAVSANGDSIECITGRRGPIARHNSVPLTLAARDLRPGRGFAVVNSTIRFRYLDKWSAVNTWLNDEPPIDGDTVIIPIDQTILLDVQPPKLFLLLIQGALVFDRINVNLDASYILVQGGLLEIGTEDDPFLNTTTITLHGSRRRSVELPFIGAKVLAVADRGGFTSFGNGSGAEVPESQRGVLDIHGKPRLRTWTKVAPGAYPAGSTRIVTSEATDFSPGETIVVTAPHQEVTIAARIDAFTFDIVEPLARAHVSEWYNYTGDSGTYELDMRFEVALLSRNIVVQGAGGPRADGSPTILPGDDEETSVSQLFGVHTGAFHGGRYRVQNSEFRHCGQAGVLGRYCMHFHQCGDAPPPENYIKSNSIHHSFQRATTIHGTHHSLVQNNVAYHVMGHTYFVEDGDETFNVFDSNIGIFTKPSHMMLKSDTQPATYWTAIPTNLWRNNVAVDSSSRGTWFELTNQGITLEFRNNSLHHNAGQGWRNYPNYSPPAQQFFHNNSYFRNGGNGVFYKKGGDNHHVFSKFAENGVDLFWKKYKVSTAAVQRNIPNVIDCIFYGGRGAPAIFAPQDEFWSVNGSTFINYNRNNRSGVISGCAGCCSANSFKQGAYTYRFQRLHWVNSTFRTHFSCPNKQIFMDLDGSLTGFSGGTIVPFYKFNEWDNGCFNDTSGVFDKGSWAPGGMLCNGTLRVRRLQIEGVEPEELIRQPISFKKSELIPTGNGAFTEAFGGLNWTRYTTSGVLYDGVCYSGNGAPGHIPADFSGCDVMDSLDWINYRTCESDYSGYAIPLVTQHDYWVDLDYHVDFQSMDIRYSEPFYLYEPANLPLTDEESVMMKFPYVDYRFRFAVEWDGTYNNSDSLTWYDRSTMTHNLTRQDAFGSALILREDDSLRTTGTKGEWHLALNPFTVTNDTADPLKLSVQALQCAPNMCGLPGDIPLTWPAARYWSDPATWIEIQRRSAEINTITVTPTGVAPVEGEHVEIPQGMFVIVDVNPPRLGKLVVVGRLKFGGDLQSDTTSTTNRQVIADRILVWGILEIGDSPTQPFPGTAGITLTGVRTSPTLVATDQHFLGNKNMVVFGYAKMYGSQRATTWSTLASTAGPGAQTITLTTDPTGWSVGDTIVISPTEYPQPVAIEQQAPGFNMTDYAATQMEEARITGITGRTLQLASPLAYRHFAGSIDSGAGYAVELRAHVGLLSSNVVIRGDLTSTPVQGQPNWYQGYGGHIVVGEVNYGSADEIAAARRRGETLGTVQKLGSLDAANVEFRDMGKLASEHGALTYRYFSNLRTSQYPLNRIANCVFRSVWNHALATDKSFGVSFTGNSIQGTFYSGVQIDQASRATRIDNNLLVGNQRSPDMYNPRCALDNSCWNHPFASFHIENMYVASVSGNIAAGGEDTGFLMYPVDSCSTAASRRKIRNNEAYGLLVGAFLLQVNTRVQTQCKVLDGMKAWKNAHIGITTVDQSVNIVLQRVHIADNHEGISLNYVKSGGINHFSKITDSTVMGSTAASTCSASTTCRAIRASDLRGLTCGSEFGSQVRRVGIVMPQYTNLPKTCQLGGVTPCTPANVVNRICSIPWERRFGNVDIQHATLNISDTAFRYWATNDCGMSSRAIRLNPTQPDFTPVTYTSRLTWMDYDATSRFVLSDVSAQRYEATACRDGSCDAVNYFTIEDMDGTTNGRAWDDGTPVRGVTMLSAHNAPAADPVRCRTDSNTGSFVCRDAPIARVILESNPPRFVARRVGPMTVRRYGQNAVPRVSWSVGPFPQGCSCQKHFAQFHFQAIANHTYDLNSTGVLEDRNRLSFPSSDPNFCVLLKVFFSRPNPVRVTQDTPDGPEIPRITTGIRPTTSDSSPSGANLMDPQARQLIIKLCGGSGSQQWWLTTENRVMVSATLSMTPDEFFGATASSQREATEIFVNNIALLLGIQSSQIRVTCVHPPNDPVCLGPGSGRGRRQLSSLAALVVDMVIAPLYVIQDISTTSEAGPNGTNTSITYVTNETVSATDRAAQLQSIFNFFEQNQTELIEGLEDLPGNFSVLTFDVNWEETSTTTTMTSTYTTTTTPNRTVDFEAAANGGDAVPMSAVGGGAAAFVLLVLVALIVFKRSRKPKAEPQFYDAKIENPTLQTFYTTNDMSEHKASPVKETSFSNEDDFEGFNAAFGGEDEQPSYFARSRAELVQDSLMVRVAKTPEQAGYIETTASPEVEVRIDPDAEGHIRPSALQHTEEPTWQPAPMSADGRISFVKGSVTSTSGVRDVLPAAGTLQRKPSVYGGFEDDEDGLPGVRPSIA